jgi:hypothetical protein
MYGFQIIEGWTRLLTVIPKEFRKIIDTAKADTDLWVNVWFLSIVTSFDAILSRLTFRLPSRGMSHLSFVGLGTVMLYSDWTMWLIWASAIATTLCAAGLATRATIEVGSLVKASIDVYLPALYEALCFKDSSGNEDANNQWEEFSQAITDRRPDRMPERIWGGETAKPVKGIKPQKRQL